MASLPATHSRVVYDKYGDASVLRLDPSAPLPKPGAGEVLIRARAVSLNPVDYKIRDGALKMLVHRDFPSGIAYDISGEVAAVGAGVTEYSVGDRVMARSKEQGTLAEYASVSTSVVAKLPDSMDFAQGAALPLAGMTALQSLREGGLKPGESVLILGGAGGVGSFAVQLARHVFQAGSVVATASTKKHDLVKSLGATAVVDYKDSKAMAELGKFDVIFDAAGDAVQAGPHIKPGRRIVSVAATPDPPGLARAGFQVNFFVRGILWLMSRREHYAASASGGEFWYHWLNPNTADLTELGKYVDEGKIKPLIDKQVSGLGAFREAFDQLESGHASGKVVITI